VPPNCYLDNIADVFVAKLDITQAGAAALQFATYLGSSNKERANGVAVDAAGNVYVTGATFSSDFPAVRALQNSFGGGSYDAFVVKLNPAGTGVVYSTFLGGGGDDEGFGIVVNEDGDAFVTGVTGSARFPTANPLRPRSGGWEAFISRIADTAEPPPSSFRRFTPFVQRGPQ
jgi:hypothetical protein